VPRFRLTEMSHTGRAEDTITIIVFLVMVGSFFVGHGLAGHVVLPAFGALVFFRWLMRWALPRYEAAPGLRGFIPRKAPWTP
jgi:hypothetical protein